MNVHEITDDEFESRVLQAGPPVLLMLTAEWCGPCRIFDKTLQDLGAAYGDDIFFCTLDIEHNKATPARYAARAVPTLLIFEGGEMTAMKVGALNYDQMVAWFIERGLLVAADA